MRPTNATISAKILSMLSDNENSVISPYGIAAVLSMAAEGASEECLSEILTTLGFESLDELRGSLTAALKAPCEAFKSENSITLMRGEKGVALTNNNISPGDHACEQQISVPRYFQCSVSDIAQNKNMFLSYRCCQ